ncbi:MAG: H-X9-DG-CTERM domain-containing protein [Candidatus Puniceispirillaceae bacterium]
MLGVNVAFCDSSVKVI